MAIEFWYLDSAWECFAWSQAHKQVAAGHSSDVVFASSFHLSIHPSIFGWSFLVAKYSWISWIWCEVFVVSFQMKNERVILSSFDHHRTSWCHCGLETHSFFVYVLASEKNISKRISWNQKTLNFAKKDKDMSVLKKGNGKNNDVNYSWTINSCEIKNENGFSLERKMAMVQAPTRRFSVENRTKFMENHWKCS